MTMYPSGFVAERSRCRGRTRIAELSDFLYRSEDSTWEVERDGPCGMLKTCTGRRTLPGRWKETPLWYVEDGSHRSGVKWNGLQGCPGIYLEVKRDGPCEMLKKTDPTEGVESGMVFRVVRIFVTLQDE